MSYLWLVCTLLSAFATAIVTLLCKIGTYHLDSTLVATLQTMIAFLCLLGASIFMGKISLVKTIDNHALMYICISALFSAFSWFVYFFALKLSSASKVNSLEPLSIVFVIFLATFIGEQLTLKTFIGAIMLTAGAMIVAL